MSDKNVDVENDEEVLYGYRNDKGMLLWTPNVVFAQLQANKYGTYQVYTEK